MAGLSAKGASGETDFKGFVPVEPGLYHAFIADAVTAEENERVNADNVTFQVITGKVPGQEGRQVRGGYFRDKETNEFQDQHVRLALATKFMLPGQEVAEFSVKHLIGRQCVIRVTQRKDGDKTYTDVGNRGFDVWGVDNPEVADVPKDAAALKQFADWLQANQGVTISMPTAAPQAQAGGSAPAGPATPSTPATPPNPFANV